MKLKNIYNCLLSIVIPSLYALGYVYAVQINAMLNAYQEIQTFVVETNHRSLLSMT